ncbi:hypothetical protein LEP1GSC059_3549 [Leptospira noguchii serovar Panama str. CZ214]|uniref:Uncharacterized protein n=1 Tax=Leptospira noguchii serovar Panama str. CZ214 TaxID=1001595 RepID=T0FMJ2_9LEPT|nr:hypothetical protein LEP1GSC059_3549 [Leptospira noguchii serovar Panama str. CZ214]
MLRKIFDFKSEKSYFLFYSQDSKIDYSSTLILDLNSHLR